MRSDVEGMLDRIAHRGPDGRGIVAHGDMVHGHVRLALLDLSTASSQPFRVGEGVLSYNGELWNFQELRQELQSFGRKFKTTGDTEVLATALDHWGLDAIPKLDGMFAFAWSKGKTNILARDRYGKIPLYYRKTKTGIEWASERKAWLKVGGYCETLPPATVMQLSDQQLSKFYSLPVMHKSGYLLEHLRTAVRRRMLADAPVCCLISGGLDSSLILTLALECSPDVVAYTACFDQESSDLKAARQLCQSLDVQLIEVPVVQPTFKDIEAAIKAIEIPSKAQTEIALLCLPLAKRIAADGFKAVLSGEAADELFGGYGNMCIAGAKATDAEWRAIRVKQLDKMARGNFIRCNKIFMAAGVECRLPFMDRAVVEHAITSGKQFCPPGKGMLKAVAEGILPPWIIKRQKDTFQGGSGIAAECSRLIASPIRFYNAECQRIFGKRTAA